MSILLSTPAALKDLTRWDADHPDKPGLWFREFRQEAERAQFRGRISVYEPPRPDRVYAAGFDCAHGIPGRDLSALSVYDKTCTKEGDGKPRQVCEAAGTWGEECFDRVVYGVLAYYNGAFVLGESQGGGLAVLRKLWDEYAHAWMYYDLSLGHAAKVVASNARLGWNRGADDITLTEFREAVSGHKLILRSSQLIDQMGRYRWRARSKQAERDERAPDDAIKAKLDGGGSPDLIMAAMYGWYALGQVHLFERPKPAFEPGTYGAQFGMEKRFPELFGPPKNPAFVPSSR